MFGIGRQHLSTRVPGDPKVNSWPFTAIVLADGGILAGLTNGNRVAEYAADGSLRWEITTADVDGAIADACGIQRLPSGNTMIASYHIGKGGVRLLEVTPEKKIAWPWPASLPSPRCCWRRSWRRSWRRATRR
jgi:outer membrane protein assembly factor BamB